MLVHVPEHLVGDLDRIVVQVGVPTDANQVVDLFGGEVQVLQSGAQSHLDLELVDGVGHRTHILEADGPGELLHAAVLGVRVDSGKPVERQTAGLTVRNAVDIGQRERAGVRGRGLRQRERQPGDH